MMKTQSLLWTLLGGMSLLLMLSGCDLAAEQRQLYFSWASHQERYWQAQDDGVTYQACGAASLPCSPMTIIRKDRHHDRNG